MIYSNHDERLTNVLQDFRSMRKNFQDVMEKRMYSSMWSTEHMVVLSTLLGKLLQIEKELAEIEY